MKKLFFVAVIALSMFKIEAQIAIPMTKLKETKGVFNSLVRESIPNQLENDNYKLKYSLDSCQTFVWETTVFEGGKYDTIVLTFLTGVKGNDKYIKPYNFPKWQPDANRLIVINEKDTIKEVLRFRRSESDSTVFNINIFSFLKIPETNTYPIGRLAFGLNYAERFGGELLQNNKNYKITMRDLSPIERKADVVDFLFESTIDTFTAKRYGEKDSSWIKIDSTFFRFSLSKRLDTLYLFPFERLVTSDTLNSLLAFDLNSKQEVNIIKARKKDYLFIELWGTWCAPCIKDMPELVKKYEEYSPQMDFVSIAFDSDLDKIPTLLAKNKIYWPQYYLTNREKGWFSKYGAMGYPGVIILDKQNKIIVDTNDMYRETKLESFLNSLKK